MEILSFFPTPVWVKHLPGDDAAKIKRDVVGLIDSFRSELKGVGPHDPWQTPNDLQDRSELGDLLAHAKEAVREALGDLNIVHSDFLVTGCWASIKPRGTGHGLHVHPNNFLSGVYYVRATGEGGEIHFHDPRSQTTAILPRVTRENEYNCRTYRLPVSEGMLILFPAWLSHSVAKNKSEAERISVSFNIQFAKFGEEIAQPRWKSPAFG